MSNTIDPNFRLRLFTEDDYEGFLTLRNLLYPDHPVSLQSMQHHEKTRSKKIKHKHWVWEKNSIMYCSALYTQWEGVYHPNKFVIKIYVHPEQQNCGYGNFCYNFIIKELELFCPIKISTMIH